MFEKVNAITLDSIYAATENCSAMLKRVKVLNDETVLLFENSHEDVFIKHFDKDAKLIKMFQFDKVAGLILDYLYFDGIIYLYSTDSIGDYDDELFIYSSTGEESKLIKTFKRESYLHELDYYSLFIRDGLLFFSLVKHNRIHQYSVINGEFLEIKVLEGYKWFISNGYVLCSIGKNWELYDNMLTLIGTFEYDEEAEWLYISSSKDGKVIVIATDNGADESGGLFIYDRDTNDFKIHYQRYGFYGVAVCLNRVWATINSRYTDLGGLMIFDKSAELKFAHLREKSEGDTLRAFQPKPIVHQTFSIDEITENKVLLSDNDNLVVTDITCRPIQEIKQNMGYDCFNISATGKKLVILNIENRLYDAPNNQKFIATLDIYDWVAQKKSNVVDLTLFRK